MPGLNPGPLILGAPRMLAKELIPGTEEGKGDDRVIGLETGMFRGLDTTGGAACAGAGGAIGLGWVLGLLSLLPPAMATRAAID